MAATASFVGASGCSCPEPVRRWGEAPDVGLLATAYLALAVFFHFHCFWNLHESLERLALPLKVMSLLILLPCIGIVICHQLGF